ncbi:Na/Pi cotransporter family protein [Robertkochia sp. 1368]|nr:Na/Pi cotransporter family protein [Robertkochia sediminum]
MIRKWIFYILLIVLAVLLFVYPNFETIGAGIAILLFGMIMLEEGFKAFAKGPLRKILKKTTNKLYKSITAGALVTAIMQSSSLVSVIAISFISAGLISLSGGMGLIFGANIGTTATAWLVAVFGLKVKISALSMPLLVFGIVFSFQKKDTFRGFGNILAGLGFFFLGIHYMKEGFDAFKAYTDLTQYAISGFSGIVVFTLLGILITTILQSSSATMALILTALAAGQIEYENALSLAIGANIGTTITAVIGSIGTNTAGRRLAGAHLIFNLVTGIFALSLIYPLAHLVDYLSRVTGIADDNYTLKLALFHTIFNVMGVLIMLPLMKITGRLLERLIKDREDKAIERPKYLNKSILEFPGTAITALIDESKYLFENAVFEILTHALNIRRTNIKSDLKPKEVVNVSTEDFNIDVRKLYYKKMKTIYGEILRYATTAQSKLEMGEGQSDRIAELIVANRKMVEIIKAAFEIGKNVSLFHDSENPYIVKEYDKFRKKIVTVLRSIYKFRTDENRERYHAKLIALKEEARKDRYLANKSINKLIRNDLIDAEMASSLVNDKDNLNLIIKNLISVAELLYSEKDSLLESEVEGNHDIEVS